MAFCPKCGTEYDNNIRQCFLCKTEIPIISEESFPKFKETQISINRYKDELNLIRDRVFFSITIFSVFTFIFSLIGKLFIQTQLLDYFILSSIAIPLLLFFSLRYLSVYFNILGISAVLLVFTYLLDNLNHSISWFRVYAESLIIFNAICMFISFLVLSLFKEKNRLFYFPIIITAYFTVTAVFIDFLITWVRYKIFHISWSFVVLALSVSSSIIYIGIIKHLPENIKGFFKKKLHI